MFRFRELIELWRSDNSLTQALNDSNVMLESTWEMYRESVKSLRHSDSGEMTLDVYEKDQMVNRYEQVVRRKVLKHLAVTGGVNIIPGLILTSIVIDIERIGDYTKNIMDLAVAHPKRLVAGKFEDELTRVENGVRTLFEEVLPAMRRSDKKAARKLFDNHLWITRACDEIVDGLIKAEDPSLSSGDAVSAAIYARYSKRIAAHLMNIITGIINPFEGIGFREEEDLD